MRGANRQTLDRSFSAVWTATIASKDAFFCIFRDLQDLIRFASFCNAPISKFAAFLRVFARKFPRARKKKTFPEFPGFLQKIAKSLRNFSKN